MSEELPENSCIAEANCNFVGLPIQNPHLGKPAYVVASYPCKKEIAPCELQEAPEEVDE